MQKDTNDLLNLRNLMKRDPEAYREEFQQQYHHFQANLEIFKLQSATAASTASTTKGSSSSTPSQSSGSKATKAFADLVDFLAHVTPSFRKETTEFPGQLVDLVGGHYETLDSHLRKTIVQSLIMLSNRNIVSRLDVIPVFFKLFRCQDKQLRKLLFSHLVNDIKRVSGNTKNQKLNRGIQAAVYNMLKDESPVAAKKCLDVLVELWRRRVWRSEKTVAQMEEACFSKHPQIYVAALRFFLGVSDYEEEKKMEKTGEYSEIMSDLKGASMAIVHVKRRKKRQRQMKRMTSRMKKIQEEEDEEEVSATTATLSISALQLCYDPQSFAERLFSKLKKSTDSFENRLLMMNVISRLIGAHKLLVLNFYPFLQKYIAPHQRHVTRILSYLAQASHNLVPEDVLKPCIMTLANQFVTDRSSPERMAVGINAIRESKEKGVMMAARSLVALFREINPEFLRAKDRGKLAAIDMKLKQNEGIPIAQTYGQQTTHTDIAGLDLLVQDEKNRAQEQDNDEDEEQQEQQQEQKSDKASLPLGATRLLTDEDLRRIRELREKEREDKFRGSTKRSREDGSTLFSGHNEDEEVDPETIVGYRKKVRMSREEKLEIIKQDRGINRPKFGAPKEKGGGTTNAEKRKNAPFVLAIKSRKVRAKKHEKFSIKMKKEKSHIKRLKKEAKKMRRRRK